MNKQREALELALLALEIAPLDHNSVKSTFFEKRHYAIIAVREALAEPEKANQCGETCERAKLCAVCANGLAEPEQEPVAHHFGDVTEMAARKPLTDSELWEMWVESPSDVLRFARAIERAHKITE